jgi:hypothetical protein
LVACRGSTAACSCYSELESSVHRFGRIDMRGRGSARYADRLDWDTLFDQGQVGESFAAAAPDLAAESFATTAVVT